MGIDISSDEFGLRGYPEMKPGLWIPAGNVPDADELQRTVLIGGRVFIAGSREHPISLSILGPVIEMLPWLMIETNGAVLDTEVLERAVSLEALHWLGGTGKPVDLSFLPRLRALTAKISRLNASALRNPHLVEVEVDGVLPRGARVMGRVRDFVQLGARSQSVLPPFEFPDSLVSFVRAGVADFDLEQLRAFTHVREVTFTGSTVSGVGALKSLSDLEYVEFRDVTAVEGWQDLPHVARGWVDQLRPAVPAEVLSSLSALPNWIISNVGTRPAGPPLIVHDLDPDERPGQEWAAAIEENPDAESGPPADIEDTIVRLAARLGIDTLPDSEGGFVSVFFKNRSDAECVLAALTS